MSDVKYAVVIEQSSNGYSAYVPDLPGCVAAGDTLEDVSRLIREAIVLHLEGLHADGLPIPEATSSVDYVEA